MFCKWYEVNGIKVQGLGEKFVAEYLTNNRITWFRPSPIKLPNGKKYTPDIDIGNYFIEVKGMRTALKMLGKMSLLENGNKEWSGSLEEDFFKVKYAHTNIKPIVIFINDNKNDSKYLEYFDELKIEIEKVGIQLIYGKDNLIDFLIKMKKECPIMALKKHYRKVLNLFDNPEYREYGQLSSEKYIKFDWYGSNGETILKELNITKKTFLKYVKELVEMGKITLETYRPKVLGYHPNCKIYIIEKK